MGGGGGGRRCGAKTEQNNLLQILNCKRNTLVISQGNYVKIEVRNENIFIPYSLTTSQFCINSLNNVTVLLKSVHAVRQCLHKGSFSKMTSLLTGE